MAQLLWTNFRTNARPTIRSSFVKNVQVIDGAVNCTYPIYAFSDELFS